MAPRKPRLPLFNDREQLLIFKAMDKYRRENPGKHYNWRHIMQESSVIYIYIYYVVCIFWDFKQRV